MGQSSGYKEQVFFTDAPPGVDLIVTAPSCAQGGTFNITYTPTTGNEITITGAITPDTLNAKKNTSYSISAIEDPVNGNHYVGTSTLLGTTPNSGTETVTLGYSDTEAPVA